MYCMGVERERTPSQLMNFGNCLHLVGQSLSNAIVIEEIFYGQRIRKAVHNWVQIADHSLSGVVVGSRYTQRNHDTVRRQLDWLYAAVDTEFNHGFSISNSTPAERLH